MHPLQFFERAVVLLGGGEGRFQGRFFPAPTRSGLAGDDNQRPEELTPALHRVAHPRPVAGGVHAGHFFRGRRAAAIGPSLSPPGPTA